jgi:hypothetical protein
MATLRRIEFSIMLLCCMINPAFAFAGETFNPQQIFIDKGVCPFECCTYRQWKVKKTTILYDKPEGTQQIAILNPGDSVKGMTGEVRSIPVKMRATHNISMTDIKADDIFYVINYIGEGSWKIWHKEKFTTVHQADVKITKPETTWWVKVKDAKGNIGWSLSDGNFSNQDACGN